ncbi:MAG: transporter [Gemmatimonadetes bacterium]|jgi:formate/nitrite transporter FocA (FNT family)|nr:transporter [Gemmatimonadota bacterium]
MADTAQGRREERERATEVHDRQDEHREEQAWEAQSLDAQTTYEVIRREGVRELDRTTAALFWSGLAAGLSMGFSFLGEALLHAHLPDARWRPLVATLGYSTGFLIVILGSQQLFTENTLTPIIPLLSRRTLDCLRNVLRLWGAVLVANLLGALLFGFVLARFAVVSPETYPALSELAGKAMSHDFATTLLHGVYAGWLIALLVWMLPGAESGKLAVIVIMTYFVGLGGFAHIIAGASEVFYAVFRGEASWGRAIGGFIVPALLGNVLGGLTMVASLNHAQATSGEERAN